MFRSWSRNIGPVVGHSLKGWMGRGLECLISPNITECRRRVLTDWVEVLRPTRHICQRHCQC